MIRMSPETRKMKIADLKPAPYNPRKISEEAMKGLTASVERFGMVQPIIWNRRTERVVGNRRRREQLDPGRGWPRCRAARRQRHCASCFEADRHQLAEREQRGNC